MIRSCWRAAGHRLVELLAAHLDGAERGLGPVLPWVDPPQGIAQASALLHRSCGERRDGPPEEQIECGPRTAFARSARAEPGATSSDDFAQLVTTMLQRGLNLHNPRYVGHQVPAPVPLAGLFDAVGSVTNQVMAVYEMGPWATAVEQAMIQRTRRNHRLGAGHLRRCGHTRRLPGQPDGSADGPQRGTWGRLGARFDRRSASARPRDSRRRALQRGPRRGHPWPGQPADPARRTRRAGADGSPAARRPIDLLAGPGSADRGGQRLFLRYPHRRLRPAGGDRRRLPPSMASGCTSMPPTAVRRC